MKRKTKKQLIEALKEIATWTPELQERMIKDKDGCLIMWRGCVAIASEALK